MLSATAPPPSSSLEVLPAVDLQRSREREAKAVRQAEVEALKIGVGVSREGQQLFDALARTLPCRWDNQNIVVLDEVGGGSGGGGVGGALPPRPAGAQPRARPGQAAWLAASCSALLSTCALGWGPAPPPPPPGGTVRPAR